MLSWSKSVPYLFWACFNPVQNLFKGFLKICLQCGSGPGLRSTHWCHICRNKRLDIQIKNSTQLKILSARLLEEIIVLKLAPILTSETISGSQSYDTSVFNKSDIISENFEKNNKSSIEHFVQFSSYFRNNILKSFNLFEVKVVKKNLQIMMWLDVLHCHFIQRHCRKL